MRLSHRARITLVSAGTTGLAFAVVFVIFAIAFRNTQFNNALKTVGPALKLARGDLASKKHIPHLEKVAQLQPGVSLAIYVNGEPKWKRGSLPLRLIQGDNALIDDVVLRKEITGHGIIVVGRDWEPYETICEQFESNCVLLWFLLVIATSFVTWLSARATFLPLEGLSKQAEELSTEDLSARLTVEEYGEYRQFGLRLNRFLDRLEEAVRREERFLSDTAHELRTPLTVFRAEIESTLLRGRTPNEYKQTLKVLGDESARLSGLVELLLRSAAPANPDSATDLARAAEEAHARWVDRFSEHGVGLMLEAEELSALIAPTEFAVVVDNLLANALRFSTSEQTCLISVFLCGERACVSIEDEGPGVSPDRAVHLFERSAAAARDSGGHGIGLALCRRILENRCGTIRFRAREPQGSKFTFELDVATLDD